MSDGEIRKLHYSGVLRKSVSLVSWVVDMLIVVSYEDSGP